ncbi:unnamed protein product [Angiostrongylus costaricensis]|uniref:Craniofacial development protein 2-like n=1 Tax=Angiostrongylus costaricensis TaxID=334426 RepID=A0A0R3PC14_ANGCS|nr:unnamed protein product [Angiostrongylus costaricensis]
METTWISKNYDDDLYLQCTYTCIRVLDRKLAHASKKHDVIGLAETRRCQPFNAVYDTGEELFFRTFNSRGAGGVGVFVNTSLSMNIDSFEQLATRIRRLRLIRCGSIPALTIFVVYEPTLNYDKKEVEAFYTDLEKFRREDHTIFKIIIGDFNAKVGPKGTFEERRIGTHGLE